MSKMDFTCSLNAQLCIWNVYNWTTVWILLAYVLEESKISGMSSLLAFGLMAGLSTLEKYYFDLILEHVSEDEDQVSHDY